MHSFTEIENHELYPTFNIGEGGMGEIWTCRNPKYAIKIVRDGDNYKMSEIMKEKLVHLQHPNIVQCFGFRLINENLCIIMEHINGRNLKKFLKQTKPRHIDYRICRQMLDSVKFCHDSNIIHGDVTLTNFIFCTKDELPVIKLVDFDFASFKNASPHSKACGTIYNMAPELLVLDSPCSYDHRIDIWALGVCYYYLFNRQYPFRGETALEIHEKITTTEPLPLRLGGSIWIDIQSMLRKDLEKRVSLDKLLDSEWLAFA